MHAQGGDRSRYAPVRSVLSDAEGDAVALAHAYRVSLGARHVYIADLDAIAGGPPQLDLLRQIAEEFGSGLLVDAGIGKLAAADPLRRLGTTVVVGLETLDTFDTLRAITARGPVCFSLDLRHGTLVAMPSLLAELRHPSTLTVTESAVQAGASEILVLDLGRVGSQSGPNCAVLAELHAVFPHMRLLAGGGVRNRQDLAALAAAGCQAALVATALHEGSVREK